MPNHANMNRDQIIIDMASQSETSSPMLLPIKLYFVLTSKGEDI